MSSDPQAYPNEGDAWALFRYYQEARQNQHLTYDCRSFSDLRADEKAAVRDAAKRLKEYFEASSK